MGPQAARRTRVRLSWFTVAGSDHVHHGGDVAAYSHEVRRPGADPSGDGAVIAALMALTLVSALVLLVHGAGFVLDDWFSLRNAHFDGAWAAAGSAQGTARPGAAVVFALVFGGFGLHPLPGILLLGVVNAVTAALAFRLLRRFVARHLAALTALLWVLLPTHTATEMWMSGSTLAVSRLALVAGLLVAVRRGLGPVGITVSCSLLAASVLTYEASLPMAAAGAVVLPLLANRRLDPRYLVGAALGCGLPAIWLLTHWYAGKSLHEPIDATRLLQANLGWGITPNGPGNVLAAPLVLLALIGCALAVARVARRAMSVDAGDWLVVAGLAVMVIGLLPFVRYFYEPQGAGDRANYLSSMGGALVWAGLLASLHRVDRRLAVLGLVALVALALPARHERLLVWSTAGQDAQAIADRGRAGDPRPRWPGRRGAETDRPLERERVPRRLQPHGRSGSRLRQAGGQRAGSPRRGDLGRSPTPPALRPPSNLAPRRSRRARMSDGRDPSEGLWESHAGWWQDGFTQGADPEYEEQILPMAAAHLDGARRVLDIGCGEGQVARLAMAGGAVLAVGADPTWAQVEVAAQRGVRPVVRASRGWSAPVLRRRVRCRGGLPRLRAHP